MKKMFSFSNFSHIAFFRKALTDGYPETSERQNPIFNVRLSQPRPGNRDAESQTILKLEIFFLAGSLNRQLGIFFRYHKFHLKLKIFFFV